MYCDILKKHPVEVYFIGLLILTLLDTMMMTRVVIQLIVILSMVNVCFWAVILSLGAVRIQWLLGLVLRLKKEQWHTLLVR